MLFADNTWWHTYAQIYCTSIQQFLANPPPCFPLSLHSAPCYMTQPLFLLTWRTSLLCLWCEYPSTLVHGLLSTVLTLLLHPPQGTPQIKLHLYIDDINNVSRPIWHTLVPTKCITVSYCVLIAVVYSGSRGSGAVDGLHGVLLLQAFPGIRTDTYK
jgi:hypothetical protein